jgi:hypothetical protein
MMSRTTLKPQAQTVLDHLVAHGSITNVEANAVHKVRSVSSRISEIQKASYVVGKKTHADATGQKYVRYTLIGYRPAFSYIVPVRSFNRIAIGPLNV